MSANPWRRKQPATPSNVGSPSKSSTSPLDGEDRSSAVSNASTPRKKKVKPKLARILTGHTADVPNAAPEPFSTDQWSATPPSPRPCRSDDIDHVAQAIMTTILSNPHGGLPASFNHLIMQVIESRSNLGRKQVASEAGPHTASTAKSKPATSPEPDTTDIRLRKHNYEAEIRRLKKITPGMAEPNTSQVRSNDIRHPPNNKGKTRTKETVYEFLKSSQKVSTRKEPRDLTPRASRSAILPHGSSFDARASLDTSADSMSDDAHPAYEICQDKDFGHVRRLAEIMARRRKMKLQDALGQLCEVFFQDVRRPSASIQSSSGFSESIDFEFLCQALRKHHEHQSLPPLLDSINHHRAFSFDTGDDTIVHVSTSQRHTAVDRTSVCKRSLSLTNLPGHPVQPGFTLSQAMIEAGGPPPTTLADVITKNESASTVSLHNKTGEFDVATKRQGEDSDHQAWRSKNRRRQTSVSSTGTILLRSPMISTSSLLRGT